MKKIGILTFQNVNNYGALLQAYALKQTLNRFGHQAEIINYRAIALEPPYRLLKPATSWRAVVENLIRLCLFPWFLYNKSRFTGFRKKYLTKAPLANAEALPAVTAKYDLLITGSDQVFNPRLTHFDSNFFLSFDHPTARKASYAASFGFELKDLSPKEQNFIGQHLPNLQYLSIREKQGATIVEALTKQPCHVNIDPSLLLTQKEWEEIAVKPAHIKEPYVLLYMVPKEAPLTDFAIKLAKEKKCKLLLISGGFDLKNRVPVPHITPSVAEWVGLFLHAQYVVTNSFHGLAFSINFKRPFFLGSSPKNWPAQSRKVNLLELVSLQHRVYTNFTKDFDETIDWDSVHAVLDDKRKQAFEYLHQITK